MSPLDLLTHLLGFVAPAVFVALLLAAVGRLGSGAARQRHGFLVQWALNAAAGVGVLLAGLIAFGQDGRIATYAALVLVCATFQWWLLRPSRGR